MELLDLESSWIDLLSDINPKKSPMSSRKRGIVRVSEHTPINHERKIYPVRSEVSNSEVRVLRNQVTLLLNENKNLKATLEEVH